MPLTGPALGALRILLVEDSPEDAELMSEQMLDAGLEATFERVESADDLRHALVRFQPDIVLSDLSMPGFSGDDALRIVRDALPEVPFIFVSGTMGEENAVAALQKGANDYIIKHQPARLPSAVARAVREARSAIERSRVETELMRAQRLESLSLLGRRAQPRSAQHPAAAADHAGPAEGAYRRSAAAPPGRRDRRVRSPWP